MSFQSEETETEASLGRSRRPGTHHSHTAYSNTRAGRKNEVQAKSGTVQVVLMAVT